VKCEKHIPPSLAGVFNKGASIRLNRWRRTRVHDRNPSITADISPESYALGNIVVGHRDKIHAHIWLIIFPLLKLFKQQLQRVR
jgi:hypothetical protein